jgi:hypothetical protein
MTVIKAAQRVVEQKEGFFYRDPNFHASFAKLNMKNATKLEMLTKLRGLINSTIGAEIVLKKDLSREGVFRRLFMVIVYGDTESLKVRFFLTFHW